MRLAGDFIIKFWSSMCFFDSILCKLLFNLHQNKCLWRPYVYYCNFCILEEVVSTRAYVLWKCVKLNFQNFFLPPRPVCLPHMKCPTYYKWCQEALVPPFRCKFHSSKVIVYLNGILQDPLQETRVSRKFRLPQPTATNHFWMPWLKMLR